MAKPKRRKKRRSAKKPTDQAQPTDSSATDSRSTESEQNATTESEPNATTVEPEDRAQTPLSEKLWNSWRTDLVLFLAAVAVFARGVPSALLRSWDDQRFIVEFEPVHSIGFAELKAIWSEPHFEAYHPLHLMSYWLDVPFSGPNGPVQHAVSLLLFGGTLLLVRRVLIAWGLGARAAFVGALLYGLHPIQVEAVSWATGRKEIVALALVCAAILASSRSRGPMDRHAWLARVAYIGAVLAKTTALPLPLVLFAADAVRFSGNGSFWSAASWRDGWKRAVVSHLPSLLIGLALSQVVLGIWEDNEMIRPAPPGLGRIALVGSTLTHHLGTAAMPLWTSPVYALHRVMEDFSLVDAIGAVLVVLLLWRGNARVRFAMAALLLFFAPVSNVVPLYFEVQDRYLSLPLLPLAFLFGVLLERIALPSRLGLPASVLSVAMALLFGVSTFQYQGAWQSDVALWSHASTTHPDSFYAWMKLGEVRRDAGDLAGAERAYRRAVGAEPALRLGHGALFQSLAMQDEAEYELPAEAVELSARYVRVADEYDGLRTLAGDMIAKGYRDSALLVLGRALDLNPLPDDRLEHAATIQVEARQLWLARFYVERMTRVPFHRGLVRFYPGEESTEDSEVDDSEVGVRPPIEETPEPIEDPNAIEDPEAPVPEAPVETPESPIEAPERPQDG